MKLFRVFIPLLAGYSVEVQADDKDQAIEKAYDVSAEPSICHHCTRLMEINGIGDIEPDCVEEIKKSERAE